MDVLINLLRSGLKNSNSMRENSRLVDKMQNVESDISEPVIDTNGNIQTLVVDCSERVETVVDSVESAKGETGMISGSRKHHDKGKSSQSRRNNKFDFNANAMCLFLLQNDLNNSSGSSTVAIDNKIEQAMDLVKSHLMFAVREEVEVLKEQIAELIERNNQLEYENGILRAAASPETLAKLAQPRQQPPPSSSS